MKYLITIVFFIKFGVVVKAQHVDSVWVSENDKKLQINTVVKNFGDIEQFEKTIYKFKLTNLNTEPLVIWHVTTSCGCTSPQWTEKPVKKNESAIVKIKYDSSKAGAFNKSIFVYTNFDDKPIKLTIKGNVIAEELLKQSSNAKLPVTD